MAPNLTGSASSERLGFGKSARLSVNTRNVNADTSRMGDTERFHHVGTEPVGRRPQTVDEHRVCAHRDCKTVLSQYNRSSNCWQHRSKPYLPVTRRS